MEKGNRIAESVDEYIRSFPEPVQKKLAQIRKLIRELVPDAEERISYRMPAYFLDGNLVYFAGFSKHIGFYPGASGIEAFESRLPDYKHAKGSIQFPLDEPLPVGLIKEIVQFKAKENRARKNKKS